MPASWKSARKPSRVADAAQEGVQGAGGDQAPLPVARQEMLEAARGQTTLVIPS